MAPGDEEEEQWTCVLPPPLPLPLPPVCDVMREPLWLWECW